MLAWDILLFCACNWKKCLSHNLLMWKRTLWTRHSQLKSSNPSSLVKIICVSCQVAHHQHHIHTERQQWHIAWHATSTLGFHSHIPELQLQNINNGPKALWKLYWISENFVISFLFKSEQNLAIYIPYFQYPTVKDI